MEYLLTIPVEAESLNDVVREGGGFVGIRTLREKWSKMAEHYLTEAIDHDKFPKEFKEPIVIEFTFFFTKALKRDQDNYYLIVKSFIDAMSRMGIIEDDNAEFVDFGGMKFRKSSHSPRIEIKARGRAEKTKKVKPVDSTAVIKKIDDRIRPSLGPEFEDLKLTQIQAAAYFALPRSLRPTRKDMAKRLGINPHTLYLWSNHDLINKLTVKFTQCYFIKDVPDVIEAQKLNAIAGNPTSAKIFLEFVKAYGEPQQAQNNYFFMNLNEDEVDSILDNLAKKHAKQLEKA